MIRCAVHPAAKRRAPLGFPRPSVDAKVEKEIGGVHQRPDSFPVGIAHHPSQWDEPSPLKGKDERQVLRLVDTQAARRESREARASAFVNAAKANSDFGV